MGGAPPGEARAGLAPGRAVARVLRAGDVPPEGVLEEAPQPLPAADAALGQEQPLAALGVVRLAVAAGERGAGRDALAAPRAPEALGVPGRA